MVNGVKRKASRNKYIIAVVFTITAFLLGFLVNSVIEGKRLDLSQQVLSEQKVELESLYVQFLYTDLLATEENCSEALGVLDYNLNILGETQRKLEEYNSEASLRKESFPLILRTYYLEEIKFWLLAQKIQRLCKDNFDHILVLNFFYGSKYECGDCESQNFILTNLKNEFKDDLLIFNFNVKFTDEPMVHILKEKYNITEYPTIIINNKKFEGLTSEKILFNVVCSCEPSIERC